MSPVVLAEEGAEAMEEATGMLAPVVMQATMEAPIDPHKAMVGKPANPEAVRVKKPKAGSQKPVMGSKSGLSSGGGFWNLSIDRRRRSIPGQQPRTQRACERPW